MGEEEEEEPYGMEVLPKRRSRWGRNRTKNLTAWKSYLKGGAGEKRTKNPPGGRRSHLILEWRSSG